MPLDPEFVADCPYGPGGLLLDEIESISEEESQVIALLHAHADLPITREQRAHPIRHPRHVSGGLMVHLTGMLGFAHAYYIFGLRHANGWVGYGGRIYDARFLALGEMGKPLRMVCTATSMRKGETKIFCRYAFEFTQDDRTVYRSDQSAMWIRIEAEEE